MVSANGSTADQPLLDKTWVKLSGRSRLRSHPSYRLLMGWERMVWFGEVNLNKLVV